MVHFEDSDSENNQYQPIEKSQPNQEMLIVDTYHNANNSNYQNPNYNGNQNDNLRKSQDGLKVSKIREFENVKEEEEHFDQSNHSDTYRSNREEKEVRSKPQEVNYNQNLTFQVPEIADECVRTSRLPEDVQEAAKAFLRVLRNKLSHDNSKGVLEIFTIVKVFEFLKDFF